MNRLSQSVCVFLILVGFAHAQTGRAVPRTPPPPPPVPSINMGGAGNMPSGARDETPIKFRSRTEYVLVPTVVLDKQRHHVVGLTKDDFVVLENGKTQPLVAVDEFKSDTQEIRRTPKQPAEATNRLIGAQTQKRLTIIAFDLINTSFQDQAYARKALVDYLKTATADGSLYQVLIFTKRGVRVIHDFSMDPQLLVDTVHRIASEVKGERTTDQSRQQVVNVSPSQLGSFLVDAGAVDLEQYFRSLYSEDVNYQQAEAISLTLAALEYVAGATQGIPGRKSLIWITGGFPFSISDQNQYLNAGQAGSLYERTMQMLNNANVSIYPVDARGLVNVGLPDATVSGSRAGVYQPAPIVAAAVSQFSSTLVTFEQFAEMTGGKAYVNGNDIERSMRDAAEDSTSYYMLSYRLKHEDRKPGWRKISVKVKRDGVQVRARKGYFLTNSTYDPAATRKLDIYWALNSPMDFTALPVTVRWTEISPGQGKRKVKFDIELGANAATIDETADNQMNVDFAAVAKNAKGEIKSEASQTYAVKLKPEGVDQVRGSGITYHNALTVEDGEYLVTFIVRDNLSGRMGTVIVPLRTTELAAALTPQLTRRP